jgi:regulator of protease activity HflC (stomatin/prohibitin superfamily)
MAEMTRLLFVRHLRADASAFVLHYKGEKLLRSGRGLAFWFLPMTSSIAELPADDREVSFVVHGRSVDYQDVTVNGVVTYRVTDPQTLAHRVDFTIDLVSGAYKKQPLEKIALVLSQLAHEHAWNYIATTEVRNILGDGHTHIREAVSAALDADDGLKEMGIEIVAVRVASVKPTAEMERALEAPARERIQQAADEAAFSRRAMAVEKERAIQENALVNQIELAKTEERLIAQRGANARHEATEMAEAKRIECEASADRTRIDAQAKAVAVRDVEGAHLEIEKARLDAYEATPPSVMFGMAAKELAGKLKQIDHVNVGSDGLGPMLRDLMEAGTKRLEQKKA